MSAPCLEYTAVSAVSNAGNPCAWRFFICEVRNHVGISGLRQLDDSVCVRFCICARCLNPHKCRIHAHKRIEPAQMQGWRAQTTFCARFGGVNTQLCAYSWPHTPNIGRSNNRWWGGNHQIRCAGLFPSFFLTPVKSFVFMILASRGCTPDFHTCRRYMHTREDWPGRFHAARTRQVPGYWIPSQFAFKDVPKSLPLADIVGTVTQVKIQNETCEEKIVTQRWFPGKHHARSGHLTWKGSWIRWRWQQEGLSRQRCMRKKKNALIRKTGRGESVAPG